MRFAGARPRSRWRTLVACGPIVLGSLVPVRGFTEPLPGDLAADLAPRLDGWRRGEPGIVVTSPAIGSRIAAIRAESPLFAAAWDELEANGVPIVIGADAHLADILPRNVSDSDGWAAVTVNWGGSRGRLRRSAVVVRVEWLHDLHRRLGTSEEDFVAALDGLLIHEIYGHLVPVVEAGSTLARCKDPRPDQPLADSCVGARELAVRRDRSARGPFASR